MGDGDVVEGDPLQRRERSEQAEEVQRGEEGAILQDEPDNVGVETTVDVRTDDGMLRAIS